jgi:hypothetical protein
MVIGPDIILDLVFARGKDALNAVKLFDAIAADNAAGITSRRAYVTPATLAEVHSTVLREAGMAIARDVALRLLSLLRLAPTGNSDYAQAVMLSTDFELAEALQFVACGSVGAKYLVTNDDFGVKRTPVPRRSPGEMLPLFRRPTSAAPSDSPLQGAAASLPRSRP